MTIASGPICFSTRARSAMGFVRTPTTTVSKSRAMNRCPQLRHRAARTPPRLGSSLSESFRLVGRLEFAPGQGGSSLLSKRRASACGQRWTGYGSTGTGAATAPGACSSCQLWCSSSRRWRRSCCIARRPGRGRIRRAQSWQRRSEPWRASEERTRDSLGSAMPRAVLLSVRLVRRRPRG